MRLNTLHLDGFGHFHQHAIGELEGPITVLYGPNEAGKSTLLAFIRAILFGFPKRYKSHYPALAGGRHGGRIALSTDQGTPYLVERYAGRAGGLQVIGPTGPASDSGTLLRRLIGPATSDLFKTVFAFSLEDLHEVVSFQGSSIYSAGQGAPSFPALKKSLADKKSDIYLTRGRVQEVPRLLASLQQIEQQLKGVEGNVDSYRNLTYRRSAIGKQLNVTQTDQLQVAARLAEITRLLDGWDDWIALTNCESRLQELPGIQQFPEDAVPRLEGLEAQLRQARDDLNAETEQLRLAKESASVVVPDEGLVNDATVVDEIRRARDRFDSSTKDLPDRQSDLRGLEAAIADGLRELGQGWRESDLEACDTSLVVRSQVDNWKERLAKSLESHQEAKVRLSQDVRVLQDLELDLQEANDKMPTDSPLLESEAITDRQRILSRARRRFEDYQRELPDYRALVEQLNALDTSFESLPTVSGRPNLALLLLLGLASAFVASGVLLGGNALPMGIAVGMVAVITVVYLLWTSRRPKSDASSPMAMVLQQQVASAEENVVVVRQLLNESADELGLAERPDASSLDSEDGALESARIALEAWRESQARVDDVTRRIKSQKQRVETSGQQHQEAETFALHQHQAWQDWLGKRRLDQSMTPDAMVTLMARVDTIRVSLSEAHRMQERIDAIERNIFGFCRQVASLASRHGVHVDRSDHQRMGSVADNLIARTDQAQLQVTRREQAKDSEELSQSNLKRQEQRFQSVKREISDLLESGSTDDPEVFRRRARQYQERMQLRQERDLHLRNLERLSGPDDRLTSLRESLSASEPSQLEAEYRELSQHQKALEERRDGLRQKLGGIDAEVARLNSEQESSVLRVRRSALLAELREHAREWSRLTIAETLLEKTRQKFERERQPSVIRHAQDFFARVTGQRYPRLYAPIGEQTITVIDSTGGTKQPSELSRGTREQLYLALRFGLIREYGEHAEGLPIVIDEALVNFDSQRARAAARGFAELSGTNQILVFTCHSATADVFCDVAGAQLMQVS